MSRKRRSLPIQESMETGSIPGLPGEVRAPGDPRTAPGVAAATENDVALASTVNWRKKETDSAKKERERTVIKTEIETGKGRKTGSDDAPGHPTEPQSENAAAAGKGAGVSAPAVRDAKRGREIVRQSEVAGKTEIITKNEGRERETGSERKTRGAKEKPMRGGTRRKRRIENTGTKRGASVPGAEAETRSTERSDLARNAPAPAARPDRKQETRETGRGSTAIVRNGYTNAAAAKSARTAENPATVEIIGGATVPKREKDQTVFVQKPPDPGRLLKFSLFWFFFCTSCVHINKWKCLGFSSHCYPPLV